MSISQQDTVCVIQNKFNLFGFTQNPTKQNHTISLIIPTFVKMVHEATTKSNAISTE